jgi:hypothetical protein
VKKIILFILAFSAGISLFAQDSTRQNNPPQKRVSKADKKE